MCAPNEQCKYIGTPSIYENDVPCFILVPQSQRSRNLATKGSPNPVPEVVFQRIKRTYHVGGFLRIVS